MDSHTFPCGCTWPVKKRFDDGRMPLLAFCIAQIPESCPATWELLARGRTCSIFQLESPLGKKWTKRLRPRSLEHLGALGAILRPGCLQSQDEDGVSMTEHFCRRANDEEEVPVVHPLVDEVLQNTYGINVFQEQSLLLSRVLCGFDLAQMDRLRRAIGKKVQQEITAVGEMFVEMGVSLGRVPPEVVRTVWEGMKESGRYQFNKAHAVSYGLRGYQHAYLKAHFPLAFYVAGLKVAQGRPNTTQEMTKLVNDAKTVDIVVKPPDLRSPRDHFYTDGFDVYFGLTNVNGLGEAKIRKVRECLEGDWKSLSWVEFLVRHLVRFPSDAADKLIRAGAIGWFGLSRREQLEQYRAVSGLNDKEYEWLLQHLDTSTTVLENLGRAARLKKEGGAANTKGRLEVIRSLVLLLEQPTSPLVDTPESIARDEEKLFGLPLSCSRLDSCDLSAVDATCKEVLMGRHGQFRLGVEIVEAREWETRTGTNAGQLMGKFVVADATCSLEDVVCFSREYQEYRNYLQPGNMVVLLVNKESRGAYDSAIIRRVWQAV